MAPLDEALAGYVGLGQRRPPRRLAGAGRRPRSSSWDLRRKLIKVAPIARWSDDDVADYIERNGLMINPLLDDGYASIGCEPCTIRSDSRAGRWAGLAKTECGILL